MRFGGEGDALGLIGLARTRARVERPLILEGRAGRAPGEVVLQREFARGHGVAVGDTIMAGSGTTRRELRVVGIGATAGSGDGWADPADVLGLATAERPLQFGIGVRLRRAGGGEGVRPARRGLGARGRGAHARLAHAAGRADR